MVEMKETANILHHASARSLILLDEVGRAERQRVRRRAVAAASAAIDLVSRRTARGDRDEHDIDDALHIDVHPLMTPATPLPPELPAEYPPVPPVPALPPETVLPPQYAGVPTPDVKNP